MVVHQVPRHSCKGRQIAVALEFVDPSFVVVCVVALVCLTIASILSSKRVQIVSNHFFSAFEQSIVFDMNILFCKRQGRNTKVTQTVVMFFFNAVVESFQQSLALCVWDIKM